MQPILILKPGEKMANPVKAQQKKADLKKKGKILQKAAKIKKSLAWLYQGRPVLVWALLLGFLLGMPVFALSSPGSSSDPLITKGWADQYINQAFAPLEQSLAALKNQAAALKPRQKIILYLDKKEATINGKAYDLDAPPRVVNETTLLPLRFVGEALYANVHWDNDSKTIACRKGETRLTLPLGSKTAEINGAKHSLLAAPAVENGRVLVPARFIAEAFGATVHWDGAAKRIEIQ